jgi:hypothetical protein
MCLDLRQTFLVDRNVEIHRPAAYLAVFNVFLGTSGTVDHQADPLSAIRTLDFRCFQKAHGLVVFKSAAGKLALR